MIDSARLHPMATDDDPKRSGLFRGMVDSGSSMMGKAAVTDEHGLRSPLSNSVDVSVT
jgi:hypothetical protein